MGQTQVSKFWPEDTWHHECLAQDMQASIFKFKSRTTLREESVAHSKYIMDEIFISLSLFKQQNFDNKRRHFKGPENMSTLDGSFLKTKNTRLYLWGKN